MAFLVLLLVSLSALTRVEQRSSEAMVRKEEARQNALLAVCVGLGRLQESTGPDRRATARAELFRDGDNDLGGTVANPRWVGVWDASAIDGLEKQTSRGPGLGWDERGAEAKHDRALGWLVSRGDPDGPEPDPRTGLGDDDSVVLWRAPNASGPDDEDRQVRAPRTVLASASGGEDGAFAYWLDDDSQKARVDLIDPRAGEADTARNRRDRLRAAHRTAPEAVLPGFPANDPVLRRLDGVEDLSALPGLEGFDPEAEASPILRDVFTTRSRGVLADTVDGGLKRDLTLAMRPGDFNDVPDEFRGDPSEGDPGDYAWYLSPETLDTLLPGGMPLYDPTGDRADGDLRGPRWQLLHAFYHHGDNLDWSGGDTVGAQVAMTEEAFPDPSGDYSVREVMHGWRYGGVTRDGLDEVEVDPLPVHELQLLGSAAGDPLFGDYEPEAFDLVRPGLTPVLSEMRLYVSVGFRHNGSGTALHVRMHPVVELTNPYDVALEIDAPYRFSFARVAPLLDFRFERLENGIPVESLVWSTDGYTGGGSPIPVNPRLLGALLYSSSNKDEFSDEMEDTPDRFGVSNVASLNLPLVVPAGEFGGPLAPGETRSFVLRENYDFDESTEPRLTAGSDWQSHYWDTVVRPFDYEANGQAAVYDSSFWPPDPNNYDVFTASMTQMPFRTTFHRTGGNRLELEPGTIWFQSEYRQLSGNRATAQTGSLEMGRDAFAQARRDGGLAASADAYRAQTSRSKSDSASWADVLPVNSTAAAPLIVYQAARLSADDFPGQPDATPSQRYLRDYGFAEAGNLRSYTLADPNGKSGDETTLSSGWEIRLWPNEGDVQAAGEWGSANGAGSESVTLFSVPRPDEPIVGLGAFRHANLGAYPSDPAFLVGNGRRPATALAPEDVAGYFRVDDDGETVEVGGAIDFLYTNFNEDYTFRSNDLVHDAAFLLNRALWDDFFLSTVPDGWTPGEGDLADWANQRFAPLGLDEPGAADDFAAYDGIASRLLVEGPFNVNSTSPEAWAAVLASLAGIDMLGAAIDGDVVYPRSLYFPGGDGDLWDGFRSLGFDAIYRPGQGETDSIDTLSEAIVEEVKKRGPFLGLAHFVNRMLVDDERGDAGALTAAIEASGINDGVTPGVPGYLTQHDLLEPLGSSLAARGDTFTIHAYGETVNSGGGGVSATARCEAVVHRLPDYVDPANTPLEAGDELTEGNRRFGRQYRVVAFRWIEDQ